MVASRNGHDHAARRIDPRGRRRDEPARDRARGSARASPRTRWPGSSTASSSTSPRGSRQDARVEIVTAELAGRRADLYRHSTAHLTAHAVKRLFPTVQIGIGPRDRERLLLRLPPGAPLHAGGPRRDRGGDEEDRRGGQSDRAPRDAEERGASRIFREQNDPLKVEIIRGIPDGDRVRCYRQKDFIDLCRGPHVPSTGRLGVFKLTHTAGAYWKGDEKNPMLQRIYGACVPDAEGARRAPEAPGGGAGAGPPQARQGARPLLVPPARAGVAVLPARRARSSTTA